MFLNQITYLPLSHQNKLSNFFTLFYKLYKVQIFILSQINVNVKSWIDLHILVDCT